VNRIAFILVLVIALLPTSCHYFTGETPAQVSQPAPSPITSPSPPRTDWEKGSPSPEIITKCSALAIYLDHPYPGKKGIDYTKTPIMITGFVSSPEAKVTVNGIEAEVSGEGSYSATIRLKEGSNSLQAVATLGEAFDEITYGVIVSEDGRIFAPPSGAGGPRYLSRVLYEHSIELKAGETKLMPLTLEVKKDIRKPELFTYTIYRTSGEYSEDKLTLPEGLEVVIEPSELTVCPNTTYISILTIRTSPGVTGGEYYFLLERYLENGFRGRGWIRVNVTP